MLTCWFSSDFFSVSDVPTILSDRAKVPGLSLSYTVCPFL